jgi:hypothetical protein
VAVMSAPAPKGADTSEISGVSVKVLVVWCLLHRQDTITACVDTIAVSVRLFTLTVCARQLTASQHVKYPPTPRLLTPGTTLATTITPASMHQAAFTAAVAEPDFA